MDNFTKQKIAEENYKELRKQPSEPYTGDFKSPHYTEIKNNAISPVYTTSKEVYSTDYKEDFDKAAKDFWQKNTQTGLSKYNGGSITANFGKDKYTLEEFFERVGKFIKESITNELISKKLSTEEITENFKAVDVTLKLLAKSVEKLDETIDIKNIAAFIHGFVNTYVTNMMVKKIEKDKGKVRDE